MVTVVVVFIQLTDGKYEAKVPIHDVLQLVSSEVGDKWQMLPQQTILVIANVTELATGKMLSSNATVKCRDRRYELKFMEMSPDSYKQGLIYTGYVS